MKRLALAFIVAVTLFTLPSTATPQSSPDALGHYKAGLEYLKQRQLEIGIRELERALAIDPKMKPARYALGVALIEAGRPRAAVPYLIQSTEDSPCDAAIRANLVRAQLESGDAGAAIYTVNEAVEGMPSNTQLIVTLAILCLTHGQAQKARHLFENASELNPDDPDIKLLLAKASLQSAEPVEALAVLKRVPPDHGKPGEVAFATGVAQALLGKLEDATTSFASAVATDPNNVRYLVSQAWIDQLQDRQDKALATLEKARKLDASAAVVPYRMAVSYFLLRRYSEAGELCEETLRLGPRYDPSYLLLGVSKLEEGNPIDAEAAFRHALALRPESALYHRELGVALFKKGSLKESRQELDQALLLDPKAAEAYFWRARVLAGLNKQPEAVADLETALALQPSLNEAYSELAHLYSAAGQKEKAAALLAKQQEQKGKTGSDDRNHFLWDLADPVL